jgi:hypothetical protein
VPLPLAYRSLPRPSSPPCAQASSTCFRSLDYKIVLRSTRVSITSDEIFYRLVMIRFPRSTPLRLSNSGVQLPCKSNARRRRVEPGWASGNNRSGERVAEAATSEDFPRGTPTCEHVRRPAYSSLRKGGDPAAGSPTATLLRLRPSHCARLGRLGPLRVPAPTSGAHSFHGVTGGVYKARERIHRGVADPRLLAIPASCSRVADCNPN